MNAAVNPQREILHFNDEQSWLTARGMDITSTEVASLFGYGRETPFELACRKDGKTESRFQPNERTEIGKDIEMAIASRAARLYGVKIRHKNEYMRVHEWRMGASFDYEITGIASDAVEDECLRLMLGTHGPGLMEVKNVDSWVFKQDWHYSEQSNSYEAPPHIELQLQTQLEISELAWGVIVAFVGGNHIEIIIRHRDEKIGLAIRKRVKKLWDGLEAGVYPEIDLPADIDVLRLLYSYAEPGQLLDATGNAEVAELMLDYIKAGAEEKAAIDRKQTAQGKLLQLIGEAEKVVSEVGSISCGMVAPTIVPEYERKGYRNFRIYPKKKKPQAEET